MAKSDPVAQLKALNEMLVRLGEVDSDQAEHARHAIDFFSQEQSEQLSPDALSECAQKLASLHLGDGSASRVAFAHWHVPDLDEFSPLWIRQAIVTEMKKLTGRRSALLLVTGLRDTVCPRNAYWTKARERHYIRVREWIDELACAWASRGSQLQVVVL